MSVVAELARYLGPLDIARTLADDEAERYPQALCDRLDAWGMPAWYVPTADGGRLDRFDTLLGLLRVIASHDLTAAIAHGKTGLGTIAVWLFGSPEQRRVTAERVQRGEQVALALTEREHGSDLTACEVSADLSGGHYRLAGSKWLINNATRGRALTLFARTSPEGGPRGFSLLLVDKGAGMTPLPKVRTLGIRGADISGVEFKDALVPATAVLGREGSGLEQTIQLLQITRTLCASLSLGAADAALQEVLAFASSRVLYGERITERPEVRRSLATAYLDTLICEVVATVGARAIHAAPETMCAVSSVVKYFVPTTVEALLHDLAVVYGARFYLRDNLFQKMQRDAALVPLFDGATVVSLQQLGMQLPILAGEAAPNDARISLLCGDGDLPPWTGTSLALTSRVADPLLALAQGPTLDRFRQQAAALRSIPKWTQSPALFALAKDYCRLYALAACRGVARPWLAAAEARLAGEALTHAHVEMLFSALLAKQWSVQ